MSIFGALVDGGADGSGHRLGRLLEGYLAALATGAVALLAVPDRLGDRAMTAQELAPAVGAVPRELRRLLAAAAAYGLLTEDEAGRFTLTADGAALRSDAGPMRDMAVGYCWRFPPLWQPVGRLAELVRTGQPAGTDPHAETWDYFRLHPDEAVGFARALGHVTAIMTEQILAAGYVPPAGDVIVDVGGSRGTLLAGLLRGAPGTKGVLFDLQPRVLTEAPALLAEAGVDDRVEIVTGDFLDEVPAGDVHVLSQVLHDWDDANARRILGNCHRASRPGGSILVVECVLPAAPGPSVAHLMDLMMMVAGIGRERSRAQHEALMADAGYRFVRDVPVTGRLPWHILEFRRP